MLKQFVGFLLRRLAIIPGDRHFHAGRDERSLEVIDFLEDAVGHHYGILSFAFGYAEGHRGILAYGTRLGFGRALT